MKKCKNCGYENQEDARFCGKCGMAMTEPQTVELKMTESEAAESEQEEQISIRESKKGKKIFVLFGVAAIILAVAVAAFQGINVQKEKKFQTNISNGKRYLEEESYDQAVEAYTAAIEINPKQVEPYRGLAKAYIALDEAELAEQTYDTAMDIISEEYTQKQTIPNGGVDVYKDAITYFGEDGNIDKVDELTEEVIEMVEDEEEKAEFTELQDYYERYWAYYNKLMELQETYGEGRKTYDNSRTYMYLTGLGFAKLFDFNADGKDELLLVYAYPIEDGSEVYAKEVWGYQNSACQKLFEGQYQDIIAECDVTKVEDKYYIAESAWDFWEYKESGFEKIKTMSYWSQADGYRVDGARVSEETYEQEKDKWLNNLETYGLVNGEWHSSDLNATLSEMENTLAILREKLGIVVEEENETEKATSSGYTWVVEPQIEADDIYYLADYPDTDYSINELSKQADNSNAVIQRGNELGIIDLDGKLLAEVAYKEIANFGDSYMMIRTVPEYSEEYRRDWEIYWLNKNGEINASVGNGDLDLTVYYYYEGNRQRAGNPSGEFVQDVIPVQEASEYAGLYASQSLLNDLDGKYALEHNCNLITDFIYDECGSLSDGLFAVCQNGKWGYVDEKGQVVIPIEYDASWQQYPVFDMGSSRSSSNVKEYCYAASDGYVVLCKDGEWELKDTAGNTVISKGNFEAIRPVFDGKCWVKKDGKWGVIQIDTVKQGETASFDDWKNACLNQLKKLKNENSELCDIDTYALIDLNGDSLPELYVDHGYTYGSSELYSYINGTLICQQMSPSGLYYIEGKNLFVDYKADANSEYSHFYSIENSGFVLVGENADKVGFDWKQAKNIYDEASYNSGLDRYIGEGLFSYDEIIDAIRSY